MSTENTRNTDEMIFLDEGQLRVLNHGSSQKAMLKDVLQAKSKWQRETWNLRNEENSAEMDNLGIYTNVSSQVL